MRQVGEVAAQHWEAFACLVKDIAYFDLEERKQIQFIVTELYEAQTDLIEGVFAKAGHDLVTGLLAFYNQREIVNFAGTYLRILTDSPALVPLWLRIDLVKQLVGVVRETDFNVQSEAIQTMQQLFINERADDQPFLQFVEQNQTQLLNIFSDAYEEMLHGA